jgi:hypothetical protein
LKEDFGAKFHSRTPDKSQTGVIPAKAGVHIDLEGKQKEWIPASAGMTAHSEAF